MKEDLLHYVWRTRRFDLSDLKNTEGVPLSILDFGEYNPNAGPDFLNAKIKIGDVTWVGNIEMHLRASDWQRHGHGADAAYNNVILHVVYDNDRPIFRTQNIDNQSITCLILRGRISAALEASYQKMMASEDWIPCEKSFSAVSPIVKTMWLERMVAERLERKMAHITTLFTQNNNDWEETFYQTVAQAFGLKINAEPMLWLARSLPHRVLAKHKNQLGQIEALLFGQAGFLEKIPKNTVTPERDEVSAESHQAESMTKGIKGGYYSALQKEYTFLRHKHSLTPINAAAWKFSKLRPPSFPTVRLAQFAQLVHQSLHLFSKILDCATIADVKNLFDIEVSAFWQSHYTFEGQPSPKPTAKAIGADFFDTIVINAIAPTLFAYGKYRKDEHFVVRALHFLQEIKAESNSLITHWAELGCKAHTAHETQGLLELHNEYCAKKSCLSCAIGNAILKNVG